MPQSAADPVPSWASREGLLRPHGPVTVGRDVVDRSVVYETLYRLACSWDERNSKSLTDCFATGSSITVTAGGTSTLGAFRDAGAFGAWLSKIWAGEGQRRHMLTNLILEETESGSASVSATLLVTSATHTGTRILSSGVIRAQLILAPALTWQISRLTIGLDKS